MARALAGEPTGTRFHPQEGRVSSFKLWLRYAKPTHGRLTVDEGAERALRERGTSLLPVGVVEVEGEFEAGDAVEVRCDGRAVGKGIVNYSAERAAADQGAEDGGGAGGCCRGPPRRPCTATTSCSIEPALAVRPRDPQARRARARRAGGRAALPAGRHGDGRATWARPSWRRSRIAGTLLTGAFTLFNFLTYGTTAQVARLHGARRRRRPPGAWRRRRCGCRRGSAWPSRPCSPALAAPLVEPDGRRRARRATWRSLYLRIGSLGLPFALIALAGQGYLRGVSDLRTPLVIVVVANVVNVVLNLRVHLRLRLGARGVGVGDGASRRPAWARRSPCGLLRGAGRLAAARASPRCARWPGSAARSSCAPPRSTARSWWPARCSPASARTRWPRTRWRSSCSCSWRWCWTPWRSPGR